VRTNVSFVGRDTLRLVLLACNVERGWSPAGVHCRQAGQGISFGREVFGLSGHPTRGPLGLRSLFVCCFFPSMGRSISLRLLQPNRIQRRCPV
jgi:hypothetical protein